MKDGVDMVRVKATGKLTRVYKKAGQQWYTVEISVAAPVKKVGPWVLDKPIPFQMKMTVDAVLDGSSTADQLKGQLTVRGTAAHATGPGFHAHSADRKQHREERSAEIRGWTRASGGAAAAVVVVPGAHAAGTSPAARRLGGSLPRRAWQLLLS